MLPLLALADDLAADARLKAPLTVGERYLPLPEFAKRLSTATKESIAVDSKMAGRKLVLYVDERPAAETMARVADALGARWAAQPGGWRLAPDPMVDDLERKAPALREAARRKAIADWVRKAATEPANAKNPANRAIGVVLRAVGPEQAAATLLAGGALTGTSDGRAGTVQVSLEETFKGVRIRTPEGASFTPTDGMLRLRVDPETGRILTAQRSLGNGQGGVGTLGWVDPLLDAKPAPDALAQGDEAWAMGGDAGVASFPLKTLSPEKDPYGLGIASLADLLARLHERSGLPVAAESFRAPVVPWGDRGGTVGQAMAATLDDPMLRVGVVPRFAWKGAGGWVLARTPTAWSLRRGEIPERILVPLERKKALTPDDYASLAGSLTEPQRIALEYLRPLVAFPTLALRKGYWGFFVFDALPPALRQRAATAAGIPFAELPPVAQSRWRRTVVDQVDRAVPPEAWVDAVLNDRIPPDAGFRAVLDTTTVYGYDLSPMHPGTNPNDAIRYDAVTFRFGLDASPVTLTAPLAPEARR